MQPRTLLVSLVLLLSPSALVLAAYHPADLDSNWNVTQTEMQNYAYCWKTGCTWQNGGPAGGTTDFMLYSNNSAYTWKQGQAYHFDSTQTCPACFALGMPVVTIPTAPAGLSAAPVSQTQVSLNWLSVTGATTYNVYRSTTSGTETRIATAVATNSYSDTGLTTGTTYYYKVTAVNTAGESPLSSETSVQTLALSTPGQGLWERFMGGSLSGAGITPLGSAVDSTGNTILVGKMNYTDDFGGDSAGSGKFTSAGGKDFFVAKYGPSGALVWAKRFGNPGDQVAQAVAIDSSDNIIVTGYFSGGPVPSTADFGSGITLLNQGNTDVFLIKFSSSGNMIWAKSFGGTGTEQPWGMAVDPSGNIVITGSHAFLGSGADFGGGNLPTYGNQDVFVAKFNSSGNHIWSKSFGSTGADQGSAVAIDPASGDVIVGGIYYNAPINLGDGGTLANSGDNDVFLVKLSASDGTRNTGWTKRFGDALPQKVGGLSVDGSGNVILAGDYYGTVDFGNGKTATADTGGGIYVVKFGSSGTASWVNNYTAFINGPGAKAIAVDGSGNIVVVGLLITSIDFGDGQGYLVGGGGNNAFIVKIGPGGGNALWAKRSNLVQGSDNSNAVSTDRNGNIYMSGNNADGVLYHGADFELPENLKTYTQTSTSNNTFLVKFAP